MLTEKQIEIIEKSLEKGFDVELQHRKDGIAIMQYKKEVKFKPDKNKKTTE